MEPAKIITFEQALRESDQERRHLLLGNGFSIALFPDRFHYEFLRDTVDFGEIPEARRAFDELGTADFEEVIRTLMQSAKVLPIYTADTAAVDQMMDHAHALKELLVQAIVGRHPERPSEITDEQFIACRSFLAHFIGKDRDKQDGHGDIRGKIYTVNYDLLLYWSVLHGADTGNDEMKCDDGFRAPDHDSSAEYVTWQAEGAADHQNLHFLHGGLHLFDYGAELQKKCWERSGGVALIDQIRAALDDEKYPLYVAEGDWESKLTKIRHHGYLQRSLKSFAKITGSLFVYGHSLAASDDHILRKIEKGSTKHLYVSLYGDPKRDGNVAIVQRALRIAAVREEENPKHPLEVAFYDAEGAHVWDTPLHQ